MPDLAIDDTVVFSGVNTAPRSGTADAAWQICDRSAQYPAAVDSAKLRYAGFTENPAFSQAVIPPVTL